MRAAPFIGTARFILRNSLPPKKGKVARRAGRLSKKPVIARRPNGPTWQSVPKSYDYQYIFGF